MENKGKPMVCARMACKFLCECECLLLSLVSCPIYLVNMCVGTFFGLCEGVRIVDCELTDFPKIEVHWHRDSHIMIMSLIEVA